MVATAKRFFLHSSIVEALPKRGRMALAGFMDELMRSSVMQGSCLLVDTPQGKLAEACGISVATVRRWEARLVQHGLLRVARMGAPRRVLELLDPTVDRADRAVDNSLESEAISDGHYVTSDAMIQSPVSGRNASVLMSGKGGERSRLERLQNEPRPKPSAAQTADARDVARGIVHSITQRLGEAYEGSGDRRPWTLGHAQTTQVEDSIERRLQAITRGSVSDVAIELTKRDVDRVLSYALKSDRPAAYLHRAIAGGDWRCDPAPKSQAAKVAAQGKRAEMPVQDLSARTGPPSGLAPPEATRTERAALESVLKATGASAAQRAMADRIRSGPDVRALTARLNQAWIQMQAMQETSR